MIAQTPEPTLHKAPMPLQQKLLLTAGFLGLLVIVYEFADRQLATLIRPYFHDVQGFITASQIGEPLLPAAAVVVGIIGLRALFTRNVSLCERKLVTIACAILVAAAITLQLKYAFGRAWSETWINNNPSYFGTPSTYGFFPFHGGRDFASFPSGHMTVISAFGGGLWFLWPRLRPISVIVILTVAVGLLAADHHWLDDIIAGTAIGFLTAYGAASFAALKS